MMQFVSYIDRQKSGLGSSEKSQKVHSANWKEEIQLHKELDCLRKQEQQRVSRITSDQRIVVHRFQRKLSTSVEIARKHEKVRETFDKSHIHAKERKELQSGNPETDKISLTQLRCLSASPKPPLPKFRRARSCEPPEKTSKFLISNETTRPSSLDLTPRPMTALEKRNKMWERQLKTVTQRFNRARSAPARTSYYRISDFGLEQVNARERQCMRTQHRGPTNLEIDMECFRRLREKEVYFQRQAVKAFLASIEPLELVPWTSGSEAFENNIETENTVLATSETEMNSNELHRRTYSVLSYSQDEEDLTKLGRKSRNKSALLNAWT